MITEFSTSFEKDIDKIVDSSLMNGVKKAVISVENATTIKDIPKLRKLKGRKNGIFYRIRVGGYRIGVTIESGLVSFARCLPRNIFYRHFPPKN